MPVSDIAKTADVFSRNEIMTSNEMRSKIGMKPSSDPRADELNNANMPDYDQGMPDQNGMGEEQEVYYDPNQEQGGEEQEVYYNIASIV